MSDDYSNAGNRKDEAARLDRLMTQNYGKTRTTAREDAVLGLQEFAQKIRGITEDREVVREVKPIQYSDVTHTKQVIVDAKPAVTTPPAAQGTESLPTFNAIYSIGNGDFIELTIYGFPTP